MGAAFGTNDPPPPDDWGCLSFRRGWRVFGELVSVGGFTGTEFRRPPPRGAHIWYQCPPFASCGCLSFRGRDLQVFANRITGTKFVAPLVEGGSCLVPVTPRRPVCR